jgi:hypothetical protein
MLALALFLENLITAIISSKTVYLLHISRIHDIPRRVSSFISKFKTD